MCKLRNQHTPNGHDKEQVTLANESNHVCTGQSHVQSYETQKSNHMCTGHSHVQSCAHIDELTWLVKGDRAIICAVRQTFVQLLCDEENVVAFSGLLHDQSKRRKCVLLAPRRKEHADCTRIKKK